MRDNLIISIIFNILLVSIHRSFAEDLMIGESNIVYIKLFQAFNDNMSYERRALITINGVNNSPLIRQEPLSIESIASLKQSSSDDSFYHLKAVAVKSLDDDTPVKTSTTFIKACSLYESFLSDILVVTLDSNGQFLSLSVSSINPQCIPSIKSSLATKLTNFNTTIIVMPTHVSNGPDTQTYVQRLEQEKAEKIRGDKGDNRSFFAKYWMYIVPVVIFLLISGAANPESGAGGGR
ncbi:ER membrane protein complex subunit 10-like [Oppia nitens]|uniref:ER membrane protein complex subunit 10-like n=1 Tax=Oppia nitens TaxID=1686743 RepID=UPI0023D98B32|nr:ER membrane protein complex subunit 10-like [Oppia nitens]